MKLFVLVLAALAAVAIAAATEEASAQTLSPDAAALKQAVRLAPAADAAAPAFAPRYTGDKPVRIPGVAQTSVDARLSDSDDVTGSLGFMCGLKPGAEKYGVAAARGYDDTGRFVGAKLRVAFR